MDLLKKLHPGTDGVIIKKGYHQSTFLPQVWEQLHRTEDFLSHLCLKAGLESEEWKKGTLEVSTYQVQAFEER
jgi:AMMECR1 domain-containing protein